MDRNDDIDDSTLNVEVALHPEGVDRNHTPETICCTPLQSPSTRRAWIEIVVTFPAYEDTSVALHPEGVDRNNIKNVHYAVMTAVALHPEGVDRNYTKLTRAKQRTRVALHPEGVDRNRLERNR